VKKEEKKKLQEIIETEKNKIKNLQYFFYHRILRQFDEKPKFFPLLSLQQIPK